jgi:phosphatidylglycerophosphate synthase
VKPDLVSAGSVLFALAGAGLFLATGQMAGVGRAAALLLAGVCVQLRLLCNLLDGMVAVEHGRGSPVGPIWNELPDRLADGLFLVGAGYGASLAGVAWAADAGWAAAVFAILTAYVRELGRGLGQAADFSGPMAKPHRMALLTPGLGAAPARRLSRLAAAIFTCPSRARWVLHALRPRNRLPLSPLAL